MAASARMTLQEIAELVQGQLVGDGSVVIDGVGPIESAGPSPGAGPVTLRLTLGTPAPVAAQVFDTGGRLLRTLGVGTRPAGRQEIRWDGADASGQRVPAGVYVLRVSTPTATESRRIVRLR